MQMIFKQLFDTKSSTYTYFISSGEGRESLIIDPVLNSFRLEFLARLVIVFLETDLNNFDRLF